jgi:hypothetical protein
MKAKMIKDWTYEGMGGKCTIKKGKIETGRWIDGKGLHIPHFYGYGMDEIIPETHIKPLDK